MNKRSLFFFLMLALLSGCAWAQESIYTSYSFINGTDTGNGHPSNLVDNDKSSRWLVLQQSTFANSPAFCHFQSAEPITPVGYVITSGTDSQVNSRRNPKSWRIEASIDNYNWVTLATFTDYENELAGDMVDEDFYFEEPNTTAYQYFKFVVTDIQGTEPESEGCWAMQLNEFQFKVVPNSGIASLTVCDDTEIIINSNIPMCGINFDEYTKSECIIPASELTDMTRGIITAITFYPSSVSTTNLTWENTHQTVFIKEVSGTTLDESYSGMSGATTVKQGSPLPMPAEGASYTITFDTPYIYHGGNLLIGVYNDEKGSHNNVIWRGTNSSYGVSAYGSSSSSLEEVNYSAQFFLPKTTFTYIPPKPLRTSDNVFLTWEEFAASVSDGNTYEGKTVYLETDITTPVTAMVGTNDALFKGTFDGMGHTLTVNYTSTAGRCAVFNTVDNASFMDLNLAGTMSVGHFPSGGLIGYVLNGCHITNCVSAVEITATNPDAGDWGVGGFLGEADRNSRPSIYFEGCAFTGKFIGTCNGWGGFVGRNRGFVTWSSDCSSVFISNCVFAPAAIPTTTEGCATFGRSDRYTNQGYSYVYTTNSYFTQALGEVQGKERHTVTGDTGVTVTLNGTAISHDLSNITGYSSASEDNGITYNGTIWAGNEDIVSLNLSGASQYEADHGTLTQSGNNWTLAMEDANTVISAINSPITLTKTIAAYSTETGVNNGWYLIASPLAENVNPTTVGMITPDEGEGEDIDHTYDFYRFDQSQELEWRNYRAGAFDLVNGQGYLYASKNGTTLTFTGTPYSGNGQVDLVYNSNAQEFKGWNLVGNPFAQAAYADRDYYALQNGGGLIPTSSATAIGAMEGIFVTAADANDASMTFSTTQPGQKSANLALNITSSNKLVDRAIVRFGEGRQLPKFQLNPNHTKVYFAQEGKDYAIVNAEEMGEMPVRFKAEKNGSYALSFNTENVEFGYLHLIDNMTGKDIDLLAGASTLRGASGATGSATYTFEARTTDYENRFKLVFSANNVDGPSTGSGTFAFYSNGNLIVNGEGTLQVIDMLGRQMFSRDTHSAFIIQHSSFPTGVYVLRLINGENVKVQKIVVR